jgi:hypothetical protein
MQLLHGPLGILLKGELNKSKAFVACLAFVSDQKTVLDWTKFTEYCL